MVGPIELVDMALQGYRIPGHGLCITIDAVHGAL